MAYYLGDKNSENLLQNWYSSEKYSYRYKIGNVLTT